MDLKIKRVRKGAYISHMESPNSYITMKAPTAGYVITFGEKSVYVTTKDFKWVVDKLKIDQTLTLNAVTDKRDVS